MKEDGKMVIEGIVMRSMIYGSCIDIEKPFIKKYCRIEKEFLPEFDNKKVRITIEELD